MHAALRLLLANILNNTIIGPACNGRKYKFTFIALNIQYTGVVVLGIVFCIITSILSVHPMQMKYIHKLDLFNKYQISY